MDKEKRKEIKKVLVSEREQKIAELEQNIAKKRAYYDAELAKEQEKVDRLKLEVEAFKGLK